MLVFVLKRRKTSFSCSWALEQPFDIFAQNALHPNTPLQCMTTFWSLDNTRQHIFMNSISFFKMEPDGHQRLVWFPSLSSFIPAHLHSLLWLSFHFRGHFFSLQWDDKLLLLGLMTTLSVSGSAIKPYQQQHFSNVFCPKSVFFMVGSHAAGDFELLFVWGQKWKAFNSCLPCLCWGLMQTECFKHRAAVLV